MVNMHRISTYDEVMQEIQYGGLALKAPDRMAKFLLEAPQMVALDPENEEEIAGFERRQRRERARREEVEEAAQDRGVSRAQLELLTRPSREPILDQRDDGFETRRMENQMAMDLQVYESARARAENVERVRDILRQQLAVTNRGNPLARLADEDTVFHDISTPPEPDIDLHTPSVPSFRALASAGVDVASFGADMIGTVGPPSIELIAEAARLSSRYGPGVMRATFRAAGVSAQGLAMVGRGMAAGGQAAGHAAVAAGRALASTVPASHRGRDFQVANGVQFTGHLVHHAHSLF